MTAGHQDIVGHDKVLERLWTSLEQGRTHQSYLFEGPKGLGKGLVARRFAMAANCEHGPPLPCGACNSCLQIAGGRHPDVWVVQAEAGAASGTISVAQIRELVRKIGYHRYSARRRVVIVDPAEAMTPSAANALLKSLEEPPEGTGFILVSHQSEGLLPTILSRCQRIRFAPLRREALAAWLGQRGVQAPDRVAAFAQGCPGKALALEDGEDQSRAAMKGMFMKLSGGTVDDLLEASKSVCAGSRAQWEPKIGQLIEVLEELLADVVLIASGKPDGILHQEDSDRLHQWADRLWPMGVTQCGQAIEDARHDMSRNVAARLVFEALVSHFQAALQSP